MGVAVCSIRVPSFYQDVGLSSDLFPTQSEKYLELLTRMDKRWQRMQTVTFLGLFLADMMTDLATLMWYFETKVGSVKILSTLSLVLSGVLALPIIYIAVKFLLKDGSNSLKTSELLSKEQKEELLIFLPFLETHVRPIPQLIINICILSISCGHVTKPNQNLILKSTSSIVMDNNTFEIPKLQLISGIFSFIRICMTIFNFRKLEVLFYEDKNEPTSKSRGNNSYPIRSDLPERKYRFDWLDGFLFISSNLCGVFARIQVLSFAALYMEWSTVSTFLALHFLIMIFVIRRAGRGKRCDKSEDGIDLRTTAFNILVSQFTWILGSWEKCLAITCSTIYFVENMLFLVIMRKFFQSTSHCLYSYAMEMNVGLNLASLASTIFLILKKSLGTSKYFIIERNGSANSEMA